MLLPGIMAISMVMAGVQAVAMPLITEFQFTREIEDRLLAPIETRLAGGGEDRGGNDSGDVRGPGGDSGGVADDGAGRRYLISAIRWNSSAVALLVALFSAAGGLALGCSVGQTQIGLMFSLVLAPMMMFGCAYYPWSALASFPVLQYAVLINPLVYASEGLRGALAPQFPHMRTLVVMARWR